VSGAGCGARAQATAAPAEEQELRLHRRDFFFAAFFLASALGLAAWAGFGLALRTSDVPEHAIALFRADQAATHGVAHQFLASSKANSPTPAAARIALTKASATGLRSAHSRFRGGFE